MTVMDMEPDYTEADRWDWDYQDQSQRCPHGTFIGSWWGPDILCHWCEMGVSVEEMHEHQREAAIAHARRKQAEYERMVMSIERHMPFNAAVATWLVEFAWYQAGDHLLEYLA